MTLLSLPRSINIGAIGAALIWTTVSFGAALSPTAAEAKSTTFYTAELAQPAAQQRTIAGGVVWSCDGTSCVAGKGTSRPLRVCRELNREFGQVNAFTAKGEELDSDALARCNG